MKRTLLMAVVAMMTVIGARAQSGVYVGTESELNSAISTYPNGTVVLNSDITLSSHVPILSGSSVTIDLNGHTLRRNLSEAGDLGNVIRVSNGGTLSVKDSSGDNSGQIIGGRATNGGGICNHGTLWLYGGTIASNYASGLGGGVYNAPSTVGGNPATFYMIGGVILGNWGADGGGVYNYSGSSIIILGGTISGNTSHAGGGGVVNYGMASISGCTIHNNHATTRGGGMWNGGTMTVVESTVSGNNAEIDGGGIWNGGTLNIGKDVNVTGNKKVDSFDSNLFCSNGHVVTITGSLGNSTIGVSCEGDDGIVTSGLGSNGSLDNFSNDFPGLSTLELADGEVRLTKRSDVIYYVERSWDGQKIVQTIRTVDVSQCTFLDGTNSSSSFNTSSAKPYLVVRGAASYRTITVDKDCSLILCDGASLSGNNYYPVIIIDQNHSLTIYGQMNDSGQLRNGAVLVSLNRILNIHGGTIVATSTSDGGSAAIGGSFNRTASCGLINIYGGTVDATGNYESAGIGGYNGSKSGYINIYGGTITARGGSSDISNSGSGIGGGGNGSIGSVSIYGGTVYAYGGNDAAGIGSGEEGTMGGGVNGGTISISGGTVYAYGNDAGAGIGAGQGADMGNITITGGTVYAQGGGGESWANAIGSNDTNEGLNSLTLGDYMMVIKSGQPVLINSGTLAPIIDERVLAAGSNLAVTIQPCPHSGVTYAIVDADNHHVSGCSYCLLSNMNQAHTFDNYGECAICGLISLSDNSDNSSAIAHWNGKTKTVALRGRTLYKDDSWNTLCLPFGLNSLTDTPLAGATVKTLSSTSFTNGKLTLNFSDVFGDDSQSPSIAVGQPYVIKWAGDGSSNIVNPVFSGVTIRSTPTATETTTSEYIDFVGTYSPVVIYEEGTEKHNLYLGSNNTLYYPADEGFQLNAFRGYFKMKNGVVTDEQDPTQQFGVRAFVLNFGDGESTDILTTNYTNESDTWYDLHGRRLAGHPTVSGIYIHGGRKVLVK